ncbi:hypothetical protein D3C81_1921320 [compost metagenome]
MRAQRGEILGWEHETDRIPVLDGKVYIPDFKVISLNGSVCYHEIKGKLWEKARKKVESARDNGYPILLLRRRVLAPIFRHFGIYVVL